MEMGTCVEIHLAGSVTRWQNHFQYLAFYNGEHLPNTYDKNCQNTFEISQILTNPKK